MANSACRFNALAMEVIKPPKEMVPPFLRMAYIWVNMKGTGLILRLVRQPCKNSNSRAFTLFEFSRPNIVHARRYLKIRMAGLWILEAKIPSKEVTVTFDNLFQKVNASSAYSATQGVSQMAPSR